MQQWSAQRFLRWAQDIGSSTHAVVEAILQSKRHKEQSYRSVLGLLSLSKKYDRERLDKACGRALLINSPTRKSVESILKNAMESMRVTHEEQGDLFLGQHENIRGENYYN